MNKQDIQKRSIHFTHKDFGSLLNKYKYKLNIGDITAGTIFSKEKRGFLVDIGESTVGYLPIDEISIKESNKNRPLINSSREFLILAYNKTSKQLIISIRRLEYIRGWQRIKQLKNEKVACDLYIKNINKGGLIAKIEGIRGFIPNSHICDIKLKTLLQNTKLKCHIYFINNKDNTIILSNKRARLEELMSTIYIGQLINGTITQIQNYGVFISIYGFTALLHISEIGYDEPNALTSFSIGKIIRVKIIHIDTQQGRLSVSRRNILT